MRVLNQAVRRNPDRFPDVFLLSLSRQEVRNISRIVICSTLKHARNVFAFTEQGVAMLSSVLNYRIKRRARRANVRRYRLSPHLDPFAARVFVPLFGEFQDAQRGVDAHRA